MKLDKGTLRMEEVNTRLQFTPKEDFIVDVGLLAEALELHERYPNNPMLYSYRTHQLICQAIKLSIESKIRIHDGFTIRPEVKEGSQPPG